MKKANFNYALCGACLCAMILFMGLISLRVVTRLAVKRWGIRNEFTHMVFYGAEELEEETPPPPAIDWEALYPFEESKSETDAENKRETELEALKSLERRASALKTKVKSYCEGFLPGYYAFAELAKSYERLLHWSNGDILELDDGYLSFREKRFDVSANANAAIELARFCADREIDFLYIQAPYKICRYDTVSGIADFSNQNADALLEALNGAGVETYDFREAIHNENLNHHAMFYRTDHHWLAETGLWAAERILACLHERFGYDTDASVLKADLFRKEEYPSWFLGSIGKRATLALTKPDDFALLYPLCPTEIRFEIPSLGVDHTGDFSALYDMSQVETRDYYKKNPYAAYIYGDRALERIENKNADNDIQALFIHDSFGDCVTPFLSMGIRHTHSIDLRHFTGSLKRYIADTEPDIVIVLYNPSSIDENTSSHISTFYFE